MSSRLGYFFFLAMLSFSWATVAAAQSDAKTLEDPMLLQAQQAMDEAEYERALQWIEKGLLREGPPRISYSSFIGTKAFVTFPSAIKIPPARRFENCLPSPRPMSRTRPRRPKLCERFKPLKKHPTWSPIDRFACSRVPFHWGLNNRLKTQP